VKITSQEHKIYANIDRVSSLILGGNPPPVTVDIDLTMACNLRCQGCTFPHRSPLSIETSKAIGILGQLSEFGVRSIVFTGGGEPMMHHGFLGVIQAASDLGLDLGINTNGTLLTANMAAGIVSITGVKWIRVSLNAGSRLSHEEVTGTKGHIFDHIIENMAMLASARNAASSEVSLGAGVLLRDEIIEEIGMIPALVKSTGFDYIHVKPFQVSRRDGVPMYRVIDVSAQIDEARRIEDEAFSINYDMRQYNTVSHRFSRCHGSALSTAIGADLKVYPCCHSGIKYNGDLAFGDLSTSRFDEVWNSRKRSEIVNGIDMKRCLIGCRLSAYNEVLESMTSSAGCTHGSFI